MAETIALTTKDQSRINNCDDYRSTQRIMKSVIAYKDFEVGTAVHIKRKSDDKFITPDWKGKKPPTKYLIVENDNGFVFAKRIISTGKPGLEITCLTIRYSSESYNLVTDEDYLDALLLDETDSYDPAAKEKEYQKKKGKASRTNNKTRLKYKEPFDAYNHLKGLKKGDLLYTAWDTFGGGTDEYKVKEVITFKPDAHKKSRYGRWGRNDYGDAHESHIKEGFAIGIKVVLENTQQTSTYRQSDKELYFYNVCSKKDYKGSSRLWYTKKPIAPEDIA